MQSLRLGAGYIAPQHVEAFLTLQLLPARTAEGHRPSYLDVYTNCSGAVNSQRCLVPAYHCWRSRREASVVIMLYLGRVGRWVDSAEVAGSCRSWLRFHKQNHCL